MKIQEKIYNHNNNYAVDEKLFQKTTGLKLISSDDYEVADVNKINLPSMSIVIPYYNDQKSVVHTLSFINKQKKVNFEKIEVIIIDDGSDLKVPEVKSLKFNLRIISLIKNFGLVRARNIGMLLARNEILMYLDSDMVLHENVLFNHLLAHYGTGNKNLIFVGYREWVDPSDSRIKLEKITNELINLDADFRIKINFSEVHLPYIKDKKILGQTHYVTRDTNYYKDFRRGYKYLHYTLSSMVHGFMFSLPLKYAIESGPVGETEKGWGADDAFLATKLLANGSKVGPLINSKGLHLYSINGSRDETARQKERLRNKKRLKDLLSEPFVKFFKSYEAK